jgi:hypothetical protein
VRTLLPLMLRKIADGLEIFSKKAYLPASKEVSKGSQQSGCHPKGISLEHRNDPVQNPTFSLSLSPASFLVVLDPLMFEERIPELAISTVTLYEAPKRLPTR